MSADPVPTVNTRLRVPTSRRSALYREIVRRLKADPTLARVVKTWRVWDGTATTDDEPTASACPYVRVTPYGAGGANRDNISQSGTLRFELEVCAAGLNAEDVFDLWNCVENVVFPRDQAAAAALRLALVALGSKGTDIKIGDPASVASVEAAFMRAVGSFSIDYRIQG